jgi:hypothetical protein
VRLRRGGHAHLAAGLGAVDRGHALSASRPPQVLLATIISSATSLSSGLPRLRSLISTGRLGDRPGRLRCEVVVVEKPCIADGLPRRPSQALASCQSVFQLVAKRELGRPAAIVCSLNRARCRDGAGWRRPARSRARLVRRVIFELGRHRQVQRNGRAVAAGQGVKRSTTASGSMVILLPGM